MQKTNRTSRTINWLVLSVLIIIGVVGGLFLTKESSFEQADWIGNWEIEYYYEHEPQLMYSGTLQLSYADTLIAYLEVYPPKSTRPEKLTLGKLLISEDFRLLSGQIVHKSYKISGGYLKESFSFALQKTGIFAGQGECLAYCAEGTTGMPIIWSGSKLDLQ